MTLTTWLFCLTPLAFQNSTPKVLYDLSKRIEYSAHVADVSYKVALHDWMPKNLKDPTAINLAICSFYLRENGTTELRGYLLCCDSKYNHSTVTIVRVGFSSIDTLREGVLRAYMASKHLSIESGDISSIISWLQAIPIVQPDGVISGKAMLGAIPNCIVLSQGRSTMVWQSSGSDYWGADLHLFLDKYRAKWNGIASQTP